jgi:hypothetical protein
MLPARAGKKPGGAGDGLRGVQVNVHQASRRLAQQHADVALACEQPRKLLQSMALVLPAFAIGVFGLVGDGDYGDSLGVELSCGFCDL